MLGGPERHALFLSKKGSRDPRLLGGFRGHYRVPLRVSMGFYRV